MSSNDQPWNFMGRKFQTMIWLRPDSKCQVKNINTIANLCSLYFYVNGYMRVGTGCPNKHGNSVTNSISSLLWISIVIPDFKIHNIIMSARVYLMKTVNGCKDVSKMSPQDEQWRRTSLLCLYIVIFLFYEVQPYAVKT